MKKEGLGLVAVLACAPLVGCGAAAQSVTRVERGPVLRTVERALPPSPERFTGVVEASWPRLSVDVRASRTCRTERVEESLEERITERSAPSAGAAIATGISASAVGVGLFALQSLFSDEPDRTVIDSQGRYGLSDRTVARSWALGFIVAGVPSVVVGVLELLQTGESAERRTVEHVADHVDVTCEERPAEGTLDFVGPEEVVTRAPLQAGRATVVAEALGKGPVEALRLGGQLVALTAEEELELDAFSACLLALPGEEPAAVALLDEEQLRTRLQQALFCRKTPGAPIDPVVAALEAALTRAQSARGQQLPPYEALLRQRQPVARFSEDSRNLERLVAQEGLQGQLVELQGTVVERLDEKIARMELGSVSVWLMLGEVPLAAEGAAGRVEVLGVLSGAQTLDGRELPVVRVLALRQRVLD